ncbi:MAG: hypothetical protein P8Q14_09230 [Vicingaceae bacterium]|nr:hypothetical protein [Vicingaceae bacterium]
MSVTIDNLEINNKFLQEQLIIIDMKIIKIIGIILAVAGLLFGMYCQFQILPSFNALDVQYDLSELDRALWRSLADQKFVLGSIALFLGALGSVIGLIIGLKKEQIGWIVLGLGLVSFVLGAIQSTHMFS